MRVTEPRTRAAGLILLAFVIQACTAPRPVGVTHHTHFARNMGGRDWGYNLFLPDGYDADSARYPVIYMLHGYGDDENRMVFMAATLRKAIAAKRVPPAIMVFPNGWKAGFFCDYGPRPWGKDYNVDSYIVKELIPHIDSTCRTITGREGRLMEGFSMGGWGALHFAFKYPELFGRVCALSAPRGIAADSLNHPAALALHNADAIKAATLVRIVVGGADKLKKDCDWYDSVLLDAGIPHEYAVIPGVKHRPQVIDDKVGLENLRFLLGSGP